MSNPTYKKALVTFVDILGFRSMIDEKSPEAIAHILTEFSQYAQAPKGTRGELHAMQFSDSIIRVVELKRLSTDDLAVCFLGECVELQHSQYSLIQRGILIRGAIAYGDIYVERDTVFGPALIQAYELESKSASWSRIVIDPRIFKSLTTRANAPGIPKNAIEQLAHLRKHVAESADGICHLDYGRLLVDDEVTKEMIPEQERTEEKTRFFQAHREAILTMAHNSKNFDNLAAKAYCLARYHNDCLSACLPDTEKYQELLIGPKELPGFGIFENLPKLRR